MADVVTDPVLVTSKGNRHFVIHAAIATVAGETARHSERPGHRGVGLDGTQDLLECEKSTSWRHINTVIMSVVP